MTSHTVEFSVTDPTSMDFSTAPIDRGGKYWIEVRDGDVSVFGNADGLQFLGELLIQVARGGYAPGVHVHLPLNSSDPRATPGTGNELALFAADADFEA